MFLKKNYIATIINKKLNTNNIAYTENFSCIHEFISFGVSNIAILFLIGATYHDHVHYWIPLWSENGGKHLTALCSIYLAFILAITVKVATCTVYTPGDQRLGCLRFQLTN